MLGERVGDDWCYYNPHTRMEILEREHQSLRQSPRPICPAIYSTGLDHDMEIPGW